MKKTGKYYTIGYDTGREIADCNKAEYDLTNPEQQDKFLSDMSEHESDVYRQFSPFEFLAHEMNEWESQWNREGELWSCYEQGVMDGIQSVIDESK